MAVSFTLSPFTTGGGLFCSKWFSFFASGVLISLDRLFRAHVHQLRATEGRFIPTTSRWERIVLFNPSVTFNQVDWTLHRYVAWLWFHSFLNDLNNIGLVTELPRGQKTTFLASTQEEQFHPDNKFFVNRLVWLTRKNSVCCFSYVRIFSLVVTGVTCPGENTPVRTQETGSVEVDRVGIRSYSHQHS